jgi:hypothetical protein
MFSFGTFYFDPNSSAVLFLNNGTSMALPLWMALIGLIDNVWGWVKIRKSWQHLMTHKLYIYIHTLNYIPHTSPEKFGHTSSVCRNIIPNIPLKPRREVRCVQRRGAKMWISWMSDRFSKTFFLWRTQIKNKKRCSMYGIFTLGLFLG